MNKDMHDNPIESGKHVHDQLSDYIDGLLPDSARQAVQTHLGECAECQADYTGLLATVRLLQNTPAVPAPRAFTLTPEMAGQAHRSSWWERFLVHHNAPRLATGSLVAFLVLFVLVAGDLSKITSPAEDIVSTSAKQAPQAIPAAVATTQTSSAPVPKFADAAPTETAAPAAPLGAAGSASSAQDQTPSTAFAPAAPEASSTATSAPPALGVSGLVQQDNGTEPLATETPMRPAEGLPTDSSLRTAPPAPQGETNIGPIILQIALLVLGLGLGAAAFVAWRRT